MAIPGLRTTSLRLALLAAVALSSGTALAQFDMTKDLPGADRPPAGRSLFDFMMATEDGSAMDVPFPIENLIARLSARTGVQPRVTMIPKGRSLQRDNADFTSPRMIVGFTDNGMPGGSQLGVYTKDRLFLGYGDRANQIEVISYNAAAGRFEFQVVKDYRQGGKPQLVYADRVLCTKCHHNGAPIFAPVPWSESTAWDRNVTYNGSLTANLTMKAMHADSLHGFPIAVDLDIPYKITEATARANRLQPLQKLWQYGCGFDQPDAPRCRGYVLQFAMEKALRKQIAITQTSPAYAAMTAAWKKYWPQYLNGGLIIPTHLLLDPLASAASASSVAQTTFGDLKNPGGLTQASADQLKTVLANSAVPKEIDPLVQVLAPLENWYLDHDGCYGNCLVYGVYDMLTDVDRTYLASLVGGDTAKMTAAIDALVAANDPSLGNHTFRRGQVIMAVAKQLGDTITGSFFDDVTPALPAPVLDSDVTAPVDGATPLALMKSYCVPCHVQLPGNKGFLGGRTDTESLARIKAEAAKIVQRLNWEAPTDGLDLMPPDGDPHRDALNAKPADRQAMMNWVSSMH